MVTALLASCGPVPRPPPQTVEDDVPAFSHIFTIVLENESYANVIGDKQAPYFNNLAKTYAVASNYYAIAHPSLPNYLALTAGNTFGLSRDCTACFQRETNLPDEIEASGRSWKAYMENMPTP